MNKYIILGAYTIKNKVASCFGVPLRIVPQLKGVNGPLGVK